MFSTFNNKITLSKGNGEQYAREVISASYGCSTANDTLSTRNIAESYVLLGSLQANYHRYRHGSMSYPKDRHVSGPYETALRNTTAA